MLDPHLAVTVVTGLDPRAKSPVLAALGAPLLPDRFEAGDDAALTLADRLCALADDGERGDLLVELPPHADVVETALVLRHMLGASRSGAVLRDVIAVATAADVSALLFRDGEANEVDDPERLALQLEFATTIVLVDPHAVSHRRIAQIGGLLTALNPAANRLTFTQQHGFAVLAAPGAAPAPRRAPSIEGLGQTTGWILELAGHAGPPITRGGVRCLVYRDPRPFHPVRLAAVVESWLEPEEAGLIVRSRGLVRLASRPDRVGSWSTAGGVLALDPTSMTTWHPDTPSGQELVFFGVDLNRDHIRRALDSCLLSGDELIAGPMEWETYYDPFPVWLLDHGH